MLNYVQFRTFFYMQAQKEQISREIQRELNPEFYDGLGQLIFELMLETPNFLANIELNYLEYLYNHVSKKRCDLIYYSNINKHKVDKFLKKKKFNIKETKQKTSGMGFHNFLELLEEEAQKVEDMTIPYSSKNEFVTFKSIFDRTALGSTGYSCKALRDSLVESGNIEIINNGKIKFLTKKTKPVNDMEGTIRRISNTFQRYISNVFANNKSREFGESVLLMEQSVVSDTVPESAHTKLFTELRDFIEPKFFEAQPILDKYENHKLKKTHAIGYQLFFFKTKL